MSTRKPSTSACQRHPIVHVVVVSQCRASDSTKVSLCQPSYDSRSITEIMPTLVHLALHTCSIIIIHCGPKRSRLFVDYPVKNEPILVVFLVHRIQKKFDTSSIRVHHTYKCYPHYLAKCKTCSLQNSRLLCYIEICI